MYSFSLSSILNLMLLQNNVLYVNFNHYLVPSYYFIIVFRFNSAITSSTQYFSNVVIC